MYQLFEKWTDGFWHENRLLSQLYRGIAVKTAVQLWKPSGRIVHTREVRMLYIPSEPVQGIMGGIPMIFHGIPTVFSCCDQWFSDFRTAVNGSENTGIAHENQLYKNWTVGFPSYTQVQLERRKQLILLFIYYYYFYFIFYFYSFLLVCLFFNSFLCVLFLYLSVYLLIFSFA